MSEPSVIKFTPYAERILHERIAKLEAKLDVCTNAHEETSMQLEAAKEGPNGLAWEMNQVLSALYEVHVFEHHMDPDGNHVACELCDIWGKGLSVLKSELARSEVPSQT